LLIFPLLIQVLFVLFFLPYLRYLLGYWVEHVSFLILICYSVPIMKFIPELLCFCLSFSSVHRIPLTSSAILLRWSWIALVWAYPGSVIGKQCFQKILVLVFWVEESKQKTWMGWGRIAWGKGSHPFCQVREEKKKDRGLLVGCFYTTLNLEVGRQYGSFHSSQRRGADPDYP
jgi:hypothetical protein